MSVNVLLIATVTALLVSCAAERPVPMNATLDQSPTQLAQLENEASAGRGDSAYQLCLYYDFVLFDYTKAHYWLERAASLRWKPAMISLANELLESSSEMNRRRGRRMMAEAHRLPEV